MSAKRPDQKQVLELYAALPEAYQPAWGIKETASRARRVSADRLAALLPPLAALPASGPLRILDIGCAQGYFTLALQHELAEQGRTVEVTGVDALEDNVRFCRTLAAHHGSSATFVHDHFDAGFFARHDLDDFDVVLALNVLHHLHELDGEREAQAAVEAIRRSGRVLFCELAQSEEKLEWIGEREAPDETLLSGYAFRRRLGSFPTHLTKVKRPLYACAASLAWVGERWFAFEKVSERSHAGVPETFAGQRRFFFGDAVVVKRYRGDGPFGEFNRKELESEASNLSRLDGEPDRYPAVLAQADDGDRVWLARGMLPGRLLSEAIDAAETSDRDAIVRGLLQELAHLESRGFKHSDLRCWNVLLQPSGVRLIDFGSMTPVASPLQRVALAAMLLEIARAKLSHEQPFYAAIHPLDAYPARWRGLIRCLLETPQAEFHYADAMRVFGNARVARDASPARPASEVLEAVSREQCDGFRRINEHAVETQRVHQLAVAYVTDLQQTLARQTCEATTEREAMRVALVQADAAARRERDAAAKSMAESTQYVQSLERAAGEKDAHVAALQAEHGQLKRALAVSTQYAESLEKTLQDKDAYAASLGAGRRQLEQSLAESIQYADSLEKAIEGKDEYVASLAEAIEGKDAYAASLEAGRGQMEQSLAESTKYARALEAAMREKDAYAASLEKTLGEKDAYAASLEVEREHLGQSLAESAHYAHTLEKVIGEKDAYTASLEADRAQLNRELARAAERIRALQRRFRWLKPLWPRQNAEEQKGQ